MHRAARMLKRSMHCHETAMDLLRNATQCLVPASVYIPEDPKPACSGSSEEVVSLCKKDPAASSCRGDCRRYAPWSASCHNDVILLFQMPMHIPSYG